jgi:L-serine/L-threonine ammonia-lyase
MFCLTRTFSQLRFKGFEHVSKRQQFCSQAKSHINEAVIHLPASLPIHIDSSHPLHIVTPLLKSNSMTKMLSSSSFPRNVYLKLENVQPSGSFKIRGIGWTMQEAVRNGSLQFVGSSGGNAGLAMAYAAGKLGKKLTLFVPRTTPAFMEQKIIDEGSEVFLVGYNWDEANEAALAKVAEDSSNSTFMVHPHNQPTTWEGHSSLVDELILQLSELGEEVPSCIVTAVGGGGLAIGLLQGMDKHGWHEAVLL